MSTMIVEVYEAFKEVGASDEKARAAASALAEYESRFDSIDADLATLKAGQATLETGQATLETELEIVKTGLDTVKTEVAVVKAELTMLKWMMGVVIAGIITLLASTAALVFKAFWPPV